MGLSQGRKVDEAARKLGWLIADHGAVGPTLGLMARSIEGLIDREKWSAVFELPGYLPATANRAPSV